IEDPAEARKSGAKSVVRREVVRLVTPGTITEELLLDPVRANSLLAIAGGGPPDMLFGLACVDISTGAFLVASASEASIEAEIAAAAAAIFYVERTQFSARPALSLPARLSSGTWTDIDAATRSNLELTRTLAGAREGTLLAAIDRTVTAPSGRLLAERLAAP